jgi:2-polyprenyl-3-methyl-5-hydroxy-6-metoxy-1,4-benzoquinol methylase
VQIHYRVWSAQDTKVFRCKDCFTGFLYPMMKEAEEKRFYAAYNEHTKKRGVTLTIDSSELHKNSMRDASKRWERLEDFFIRKGRILEIGSSTGAFLEICSQKCDCVCVEPDSTNREFASQFSVGQYEYLEDVSDLEKFDVICLFHVFEHIRNPFDFLKKCGRLLKTDGSIIIEVPHIEDPLLSIYDLDSYKDFYFQPMHHYIYSVKGLKYVFESEGFHEKDIVFYQRYGLDNHLAWLKNGKPGGDLEFQKLFGNSTEYCQVLEKAQKTDTIIYIAEKNWKKNDRQ